MTTTSAYVPGMCNINKAEIAYRRKAMWFGLGLSVALFGLLLIIGAAWWLGVIVLFVPAYIGAINFLQVRNRFCVSYAGSGRQNADENSQAASEITDTDALRADKTKARRMNLQALGMTLAALTIVAIVLYVA